MSILLRGVNAAGTPALDGTDDFNRANEDPIGYPWTSLEGGTAKIVSNQLVESAATADTLRYELDHETADHYAEIETHGVAGDDLAVLVRLTSAATLTYYMARFRLGNLQIYKRIAGTFTLLAQKARANPAVPYTTRLSVIGDELRLSINGVTELTAVDSSITVGTYGGVRITSTTGDNFETAAIVLPDGLPWDFYDTFVGFTTDPVYNRIPDTKGLLWNGFGEVGGSPGEIIIDGNDAMHDSVGTDEEHVFTDNHGYADSVLRTQILAPGSGGTINVGIFLRRTSTTNYWYAKLNSAGLASPNAKLQLIRRISGATSVAKETSVTVNSFTLYTLEVRTSYNSFRVYLDGVQLLTELDERLELGVNAGLFVQSLNDANSKFKYFGIRPYEPNYALHDTFSGPSESLQAHTMDVGPGWGAAEHTGTVSSWTVNGAGTLVVSGGTSSQWVSSEGNASDGICLTDVTLQDATTRGGIIFRYSDSNNFWMARLSRDSNVIELYKRLGGTFTLEASIAQTLGVATYEIGASFLGSTIKVMFDGLTKLSHTSVDLQANTKHGFYAYLIGGSLDITFDNFRFDPL